VVFLVKFKHHGGIFMLISCPNCGEQYDVDNSFEGQKVECGKCGKKFFICKKNEIQIKTQITPIDLGAVPIIDSKHENKRCPMCGEIIHVSAKICRFCNAVLDDIMAQNIANATNSTCTWITFEAWCSIILSIVGFIFFVIFLFAF
jgi:predicted Zn finger-like uncharacterized protein